MAVLNDQPLHGYLVVQRLAEMEMFRCQPPDPTGVYRLLRALEQDGMVRSEWALSQTGPAKRRFALTASGRKCLDQWAQTLEQYARSIDELARVIHSSGR